MVVEVVLLRGEWLVLLVLGEWLWVIVCLRLRLGLWVRLRRCFGRHRFSVSRVS